MTARRCAHVRGASSRDSGDAEAGLTGHDSHDVSWQVIPVVFAVPAETVKRDWACMLEKL